MCGEQPAHLPFHAPVPGSASRDLPGFGWWGVMQPRLTSPAGPAAGPHTYADGSLTPAAPGSPSAIILGS